VSKAQVEVAQVLLVVMAALLPLAQVLLVVLDLETL
jgi:hypothetical protein